jgi:hypothetical protein
VGLNRGIARWAAGDSAAATRMIGPAVAEAGGYVAACRLLALAPEDSLDVRAGLSQEDLTLRRGIRSLLRANVAAGSGKRPSGARAAEVPSSPPAPRVRAIGKHLYWIE